MNGVNRMVARIMSMILVAAILAILFASMALAKRDEIIYPSNLSVGNVAIGNMNRQDALNILKTNLKSKWGDSLRIQYKESDDILDIPLQDCGIGYDLNATLTRVDNYISNKKFMGLPLPHAILRGGPINISPVLSIKNTDLIYSKLLELKKGVDKPATDARVIYDKGYLEYIVHENGTTLDVMATMKKIGQALQEGSLGPVKIVTSELYPRVKTEDIEKVKELLAVYVDSLSNAELRNQDLQKLITGVNGSIVMPGYTFYLAELQAKAGIKAGQSGAETAAAILAQDIYNACSPSQFEITTAPSPGNDYNIEFKNNLDYPILLSTSIEEDKLLVRVFGCQTEAGTEILLSKEQTVLSPEVVTRVDPELKAQESIVQQEGKAGMRVRTYRVVKKNGREVSKNLLAEDITPPLNTIMLVSPTRIVK